MFKFFNKKNKEKVNVLNKRNSNWKMITSLSCASLLTIGAVGGIAGSITASALKYKLSDDYSNFYLCRYELDPYRNDDPTMKSYAETHLTTPEQWAKAGDEAANSFSHYLSSIGYSSGLKVTSEVYAGDDQKEKIFIDAYIPKSEVKEGNDNQPSGWDSTATHYSEDVSNYINHMNSNRITMILDPNDGTGALDDTNNLGPAPMAINMEEMISNPGRNIKVDKDNINIQFDGDGSNTINQSDWFNNNSKNGFIYNFFSNDGEAKVDDSKGQVYILRDQDALINRMVFILQCAMYGSAEATVAGKSDYSDEIKERRQNYIDNWRTLTDNEQKWALAVLQTDGDSGKVFSTEAFKLANPGSGSTPINYYDFKSNMASATTTVNPTGTGSPYAGVIPSDSDAYQKALGYFYRFIDTKNYTKPTTGNTIIAPKGHGGNGVEWDWMKPYVIAIINNETALTAVDKYDDSGKDAYFPQKNPNDSADKKDIKNLGKYMSIKFNTEFDAKQFKEAFTSYHLAMPVKNFNITTSAASVDNQTCEGIIKTADKKGIKDTTVIIPVKSNINGNFFSKSSILLAILSLVAVILIIGIIVSTIFRIPGFLAWLFITCTTSMVLLFMILANNPISLGIIMGLFAGITLSTMCVFIFMQKLHKYVKREENIVSGFRKAVNNSIWKIIDIHVLGIIVGVCLTYFGISITNMFALTLLLFSLVDIILIGLWVLTSALFLLTRKTDTKTNLIFPSWYFVKNVIEVENTTFNDKKFETTYMPYYKKMNFSFVNELAKKAWLFIKSPFKKNKDQIEKDGKEKSVGFRLNFFGFKKEIIGLTIVAIIMIIGTALLFTIGSHSSYYFFGGTRIVIDGKADGAQNFINQLKNMGFSGLTNDGGFYYIYSSKILDAATFNVSGLNSWYFVQRVGHISMGGYISKFAIVFLIASALASAYGFFRIGWTSVLPIFIGSLVAPLFTLLTIFTFQIYIDTNIFMFIAILYVISLVLVFGYISNIDNKWTKYQKFNINELKTAYNLETASSFRFYYLLVFMTFIFSVVGMMIFGSSDLIASLGMLLIGLICTTAIMLYVVRPICFWMTVARFSYSKRIGENKFFFKKNYDKIDEQNIDGINKFKKETIQL